MAECVKCGQFTKFNGGLCTGREGDNSPILEIIWAAERSFI